MFSIIILQLIIVVYIRVSHAVPATMPPPGTASPLHDAEFSKKVAEKIATAMREKNMDWVKINKNLNKAYSKLKVQMDSMGAFMKEMN